MFKPLNSGPRMQSSDPLIAGYRRQAQVEQEGKQGAFVFIISPVASLNC